MGKVAMNDISFTFSRTLLELTFQSDGTARTHGVILVEDDTAPVVLTVEPGATNAACADADGDGVGGLTSLQFVARDARSGALLLVSLTPFDGEIDEDGQETIGLVIGGTTVVLSVEVQWFDRG